MKRLESVSFESAACIPFENEHKTGFALPLFSNPKFPNVYFVQEVDEYRNTVSSFRMLDRVASEVASETLPLEGKICLNVGSAPVYAFIDERGRTVLGNLDQIKDTLSAFTERCGQQLGIVLQIAELIGSDDQKRVARVRMRSSILRTSGHRAASAFYERSALQAVLWERLLHHAPGESSARRILAARSRIGFSINDDGVVTLDLQALDPDDLASVDLNKITQDLEFDIKLARQEDDEIRSSAEHNPDNVYSEKDIVRDAIHQLGKASRQEERISLVLDTLLRNRDAGRRLLRSYPRDKASYASAAIENLNRALRFGDGSAESMSDRALVQVALEPFLSGLPNSRALVFLYMAQHLSKYPEVGEFLTHRLEGLNSYAFQLYRNEINRHLYKGRLEQDPREKRAKVLSKRHYSDES